MRRLRLWLARKLVGGDILSLTIMGTDCLTRAMTKSDSDIVMWESRAGLQYSAARHKTLPVALLDDSQSVPDIYCNCCTNVFPANLNRECRCPSCGSNDLQRA